MSQALKREQLAALVGAADPKNPALVLIAAFCAKNAQNGYRAAQEYLLDWSEMDEHTRMSAGAPSASRQRWRSRRCADARSQGRTPTERAVREAALLVNAFHAFRSRKKLPAVRAELRVSQITLHEVRRECTEWHDAYTTVRDRYADTAARLQDVEGAYAKLGSEASHTAQRLEETLQNAAAHEQHVREER